MIHPQGLLSAVNNCELCFSWFLRYCPLPYCFFLDFKPYPSKTWGTPVLCLLTAPSSTTNSQFSHLSSYLLKSSKRIYIYKYNWHLQVMLMCTQPWRITFTEVYWNATFLHLHLLLLCQFSAPVIFASGRINRMLLPVPELFTCFSFPLSSIPPLGWQFGRDSQEVQPVSDPMQSDTEMPNLHTPKHSPCFNLKGRGCSASTITTTNSFRDHKHCWCRNIWHFPLWQKGDNWLSYCLLYTIVDISRSYL